MRSQQRINSRLITAARRIGPPSKAVEPLPTNGFNVVWSATPAAYANGVNNSVMFSDSEIIIVNNGTLATSRLGSIDCTQGSFIENWGVVAPGGLFQFGSLGHSANESEIVLNGVFSASGTRNSSGLFSRTDGSDIHVPALPETWSNSIQINGVGINDNEQIWQMQRSGGTDKRKLFDTVSDTYSHETAATGDASYQAWMIPVPGTDDILYAPDLALDELKRLDSSGTEVWQSYLGKNGIAGSLPTTLHGPCMTVHNGRVYFFAVSPDGSTLGAGTYVCSRSLDGSDWQEHVNVSLDTPSVGFVPYVMHFDLSGDLWIAGSKSSGTDIGDVLRYDSGMNLVYSFRTLDPTNPLFTTYHTTSSDKFSDIRVLHESGRIVLFGKSSPTRLRITSISLT